MKLDSLAVEQTIYRLAKRKMGNTTLQTYFVQRLVVKEIDTVRRRIVVMDGTRRLLIPEGRLGQYRLQAPELVSRNGFSRPLTATERAARKAGSDQQHESNEEEAHGPQ